MICPHCGAKIADTDRLCPKCNMMTDYVPTQKPPAAKQSNGNSTVKKNSKGGSKKKKHTALWTVLGILIVFYIIGSSGGDKGTSKSKPASKAPTPTTQNEPNPEPAKQDAEPPAETKSHDNVENKTSLKGRGWSDSGRSEPQYVGVGGYVVIDYNDYEIKKTDECLDAAWEVPIYEKDKQFYEICGSVPHKTKVTVKSQELEHEGYGAYSGYLIVEPNDTNDEFCIDVGNFITDPYWESDNLLEAALDGYYIAEFNQTSDYYPVDKSNEKVILDDGMKILVTGKTGLYGRNGPDDNTNPIEAIVFKDWKYGYGGVSVFFNEEDLTIIY